MRPKGRQDPIKHRDQVRRANAARKAAIDRLIRRYPHLFDRLYAEEAKQRGVEPTGRRK
jgi:hypothetical protein